MCRNRRGVCHATEKREMKRGATMTETNPGNTRSGVIFALIFAIVFLASIPMYSQVVGGTLLGAITAPTGAAIPGAKLVIKNVATGVTTTVTTNAQGIYNAPNLLPGTYEATISAAGFTSVVQGGIALDVGAQQVLNVAMKVGQVTQRVEVSEIAPDVQLASSAISGEVTSNAIVQLPLNARSWTDLAILQPGVNAIRQMVSVGTPDRLGRGLGEELSIAGGRPQ